MSDLPAVLAAVQTVQQSVPGVLRVYDAIPESIEDTPCFVTLPPAPGTMRIEGGYGQERCTYPLVMRLYLTRQDAPEASARALALIQPVLAAFRLAIRLGGLVTLATIDQVSPLGTVEHGGIVYLVVEFTLTVRQHTQVEYAS